MLNAFSDFVVRPAAATLLALSLTCPVWAQEPGTTLFRDLRYDAPISAFGEAQSYYDCSADVGATARCIDNVKFLGHTFDTQLLIFVGDRLRGVGLKTRFKLEIYNVLMRALAADFTMIMMESADRRLDLVDKESIQRILLPPATQFESIGLQKGDLTLSFVELPAAAVKKFPTALAAITESPRTTRNAVVIVEENDNESSVGVIFTLPRRAREDMLNMPVPKEKF